MPVWYSSVVDEHLAVRNGAGLFDVTHMGAFDCKGPDAAAFLDAVTTNDVFGLDVGDSHYTYLLDVEGVPLDDLMIYCLADDHFLLVVNASNNDKNWAWLNAVKNHEVMIDPALTSHTAPAELTLRDLRDPSTGDEQRVGRRHAGILGLDDEDHALPVGARPGVAERVERLADVAARRIGEIDPVALDAAQHREVLVAARPDEDDDRPLWILIWGGGNTLAQAIWQVQQNRNETELKAFLHKIPTYAITDQDRSYKSGTPFDISSHQWMRREFKNDLLFLWDECAWKCQNGIGKKNWNEYAQHIQSHGNLGKVYPKYKFGVEGDTPSFLHVMPNGLSNPLIPDQVSWGGYFEWGKGPDGTTYAFTNHEGRAYKICSEYFEYFYPATFNNFTARMDWANEGKGNRNPVIIINGDNSIEPVHVEKKQGRKIKLDASKTFDPEDDELIFKWWILPEAGSYKQEIDIPEENSKKITIQIPSDSAGKSIHMICEVSDNGKPGLTSYRRIIIQSKE